MTSIQRKKLKLKLNDKRVDLITKMMEREPELFSFLWIRMSVESQEEIRAHDVEKFKIIFQNKDPVGLFAMIRDAHSANPNGTGAAAFRSTAAEGKIRSLSTAGRSENSRFSRAV
jgi:hypothetical protein